MPELCRHAPVRLVLLLALLLGGMVALLPASPAAADDVPADDPVQLVIATAGLTWDDVSAEETPALQCLADRSGAGAMNTTSSTVVSTKRQGMETLRTGYRGLAEEAPRTSGIPTPPTDQWEQLPVDTVEIDAPATGPSIADDLQDGSIVLVDVGSVPSHDEPARSQQLAALNARVAEVLEAAGGCDAAELPRTLLVSVAATDPEDPERMERTGAVASRTVGLQVALDSALPGQEIGRASCRARESIAVYARVRT